MAIRNVISLDVTNSTANFNVLNDDVVLTGYQFGGGTVSTGTLPPTVITPANLETGIEQLNYFVSLVESNFYNTYLPISPHKFILEKKSDRIETSLVINSLFVINHTWLQSTGQITAQARTAQTLQWSEFVYVIKRLEDLLNEIQAF